MKEFGDMAKDSGSKVSSVLIRVIVYIMAVILGGIGVLSLVIDPIPWLGRANSLREVFEEADLLFFVIAPVRVVRLAAVIAALMLVFLPSANNYFRRASSAAGTQGSSTVVQIRI
jgi:hypothetical protein